MNRLLKQLISKAIFGLKIIRWITLWVGGVCLLGMIIILVIFGGDITRSKQIGKTDFYLYDTPGAKGLSVSLRYHSQNYIDNVKDIYWDNRYIIVIAQYCHYYPNSDSIPMITDYLIISVNDTVADEIPHKILRFTMKLTTYEHATRSA